MSLAEIQARAQEVPRAASALGATFASVAQRARCRTMGAMADLPGLGDWTRMSVWLLAMGVAVVVARMG